MPTGSCQPSALYRFDPKTERRDHELDLRDAIQRIALQFPCYGRPRITAELRRQGWEVNHKRVLRIMRDESLLCQLRRRWVRTTDSEHGLTVYPNLLPPAGWRQLTGINQAWVADITYIRLPQGFCYLAALLDAVPVEAKKPDYSSAIIDQNVLGKATASTRLESYERLSQLYSLDRGVVLFRALRHIWNLERDFNNRAGFTSRDDTLPKRLLTEPARVGPAKGLVNGLDKMLPEYYALRGWDGEGRLTPDTRTRLGL